MKIIVAIKRVVDYKAVIRLQADGKAVDTSNVKMSMNPFDEIALEEALRLKEQGIAKEVIAVSIGKDSVIDTLRQALAMGADRAELIKTDDSLDPLTIAKTLKVIVEKEGAALCLLGKQAIDSDDNQVGQMLAALLNWPQATFASKVIPGNESWTVTREIDGGLETLTVKLPAVITTDLRLNEPRYIALPNIIKAKQKPLQQTPLAALGINPSTTVSTTALTLPEKKRAGIKLATVQELIERLTHEAHIL